MAVTSVDIDEGLLAEAKAALGVVTTRAAVDQALRETVMRRRQGAALDRLTALDLEVEPTKQAYAETSA